LSRLLKKAWLDSFLDYTAHTETPREYLLWGGISTISSALKRNIFIWYYDTQITANQYIILVGPPGIGKGVAISKGFGIARKAKAINYIKNWHTPQEVIEKIAEGFSTVTLKPGQVVTANMKMDHTACIVAPELAVFLQNYENLHSLLCDLWDQKEFDYGTRNKGKFQIEDMSVSLLGGCVPDYVRNFSKDRLAPITGGFTARTIFVYASEKYQLVDNNFGSPTTVISQLENDLINDLAHISTLKGEVKLDKKAVPLWEETYKKHNARGNIDSDASQNFKSRISTHIIKTALSVSLSESDSLIITKDQLQRAIGYVEGVRDKVDVVFRCIGESPLAVAMSKAQAYIDAVGMCSYKTLLKYMYRDSTEDQLNAIVTVLEKTGLIITKIDLNGNLMYWSTSTGNGSNPHKGVGP
jgi:hypothetical protein